MVNKRMLRSVLLTLLLCGFLIGASQAQERQQQILNRLPNSVLDVQYSADGQYLARVYADGRLEVINASTNRIVLEDTIELPNSLQRAKVDWSPVALQLAAGIGAQIYIWDVENGRLVETVEAGGDEPLVYREDGSYEPEGFASVQWDINGTLLMAQSLSSRFTVWSTERQAFILDQVVGNNPVPVAWLADDQHISDGSGFFDIQTQEYIVRRVERIPEVTSNCGPNLSIASNSDRSRFVQGTFNGCIVILDSATGNEIAGYKIADNRNPIWDVSWSPDDSAIVAVDSLGAVQVVEVATGSVALVAQRDGELYAVDWADTNTAIAYGGNTQTEETVFATVSVAEVDRLMTSAARQPEFAIMSSTDR